MCVLLSFVGQVIASPSDLPCESEDIYQLAALDSATIQISPSETNDCCNIDCCELGCSCIASLCSPILYLDLEVKKIKLPYFAGFRFSDQQQPPNLIARQLYRPPIFTS